MSSGLRHTGVPEASEMPHGKGPASLLGSRHLM